jgi:uncharacterized protein YuzE
MRLHVDKEADALYLRLDDSKIMESEEVSPGVIVDYNRRNAVVGVEVLYLSKRTPKSGARKHSAPDATAALVLHDKPPKKSGA